MQVQQILDALPPGLQDATQALADSNALIATSVQSLQDNPRNVHALKQLIRNIEGRLVHSREQLQHMVQPVAGVLAKQLKHVRTLSIFVALFILLFPIGFWILAESCIPRQGQRPPPVTFAFIKEAIELPSVQMVTILFFAVANFYRISKVLVNYELSRRFQTLFGVIVFMFGGVVLVILWPAPSYKMFWFTILYTNVVGPLSLVEWVMSIGDTGLLTQLQS